ncbi:MAG: hypothetical protein LBC71_06290 [Oscillospiraceae bacterium]|nr:hypothetical protein [Oscillospiraceae bacterium]
MTKVLKKYPDAKFLEAIGFTSTGQWISNPNYLDKINVVFAIADGADAVMIDSVDFAEFSEPYKLGEPYLGCRSVDFVNIKMHSDEAVQLKEKAGYKEPFNGMLLFHPLNAVTKNPVFMFCNQNSYIFVDTVTKEVSKQTLRSLIEKL